MITARGGLAAYRSAMGQVHVLGNPTTRGGTAQLDEVVGALGRHGIEATILEAGTPAEARAAAQRAVDSGTVAARRRGW